MAVPELVVAAAPYKVYPGGVIAFRAIDWLGPARGTLSTETDARAIEGSVVRDTQATASVVRTAELTAYQNADDTLEIDLTGVPVELGILYDTFVSLLIEGDWDTTSAESYRESTPVGFRYTARLGLWGDDFYPDLTSLPNRANHYPRNNPHYAIVQMWDAMSLSTGTETLHLIAFAGPGSTVEWLIDQVILVPNFASGQGSILYIGGAAGQFQGTPIVDGADGGDINGKFTWHAPETVDEPYTLDGGDTGGGDYQKADNEYMIEVPVTDGYFFGDASGALALANAYSIHGAYFRDIETYELDEFTRTQTGIWGTTPRGYRWQVQNIPQQASLSVDGSRAKIHFTGTAPRDSGRAFMYLFGSTAPLAFAIMRGENFTYSGKVEIDGGVLADGLTDFVLFGATIHDAFIPGGAGSPDSTAIPGGVIIDALNAQWKLKLLDIDLSSWIDISSWFALGTNIGFKVEIRRHRVRARVWDATGAEPSTWDVDDWRPVHVGTSNLAYSYSDDPLNAIESRANLYCGIFGSGQDYIAQWDVYADDIKVEYDPVGTTDDVNALMEAPEGTEVGRITIPSGAWHFVYWGVKAWVEADGFGDPNLSFASKVWSEAGAAELQRAEAPFWWFRSAPGGLVPMNWRSSERPGSVRRVLVGDR